MRRIANQIRRLFVDDGRNDRNFTDQEQRLRQAQRFLVEAADSLRRAADLLADCITSNLPADKK